MGDAVMVFDEEEVKSGDDYDVPPPNLDFMQKGNKLNLFKVSLRPPAHPPPPADSGCSWVLLDVTAYVADRTNATAARAFTSRDREIQVTFFPTPPPRVSCFCVHCPAVKPEGFAIEPNIIATHHDLVLLRTVIGPRNSCFDHKIFDFFVYRANSTNNGGPGPSLNLLPHPGPSCYFVDAQVGIILCDADAEAAAASFLRPHGASIHEQHYIIAALSFDHNRGVYNLHRFHSNNGNWNTKALHLGPMEPSPGFTFFFHDTYKVITLGGGFMALVDLWQGILLCNVLLDNPKLHYIRLPPPLTPIKHLSGDARLVRDIAVVQGYIKYVELQSCRSDGWVTATWSRKITLNSSEGDWHKDCELHVSDISGSLPELLGDEEARTAQLNLQSLHPGNPMLSLHDDDDDVVYFLAKVDFRDNKSYVLAVNMRNKTLQGAAHFGAERMAAMSFTYTQSRISHYLKTAPDNSIV